MKSYKANNLDVNNQAVVMYIDMNSYFASCEQQRHPELRGKAVGVVAYDGPNAAVIAASIEAKRKGVKTGMRLGECRMLCPEIIPVTTHPAWYRQIHVDIMAILHSFCDDVFAKSIDEAVMNFTSYRLVYKDFFSVARQIKAAIKDKHDYLTCSIGIAPNSFLAKLGTELQKPDGLIEITPENIDGYLATLKLTDLPGIATKNERRLLLTGIKTPLEMRHSSPALLRKIFGGIVGDYWHARLNFKEVDLHNNSFNRTMSATRTLSSQQRANKQTLDSMLIALCTRLEQRMVKSSVFCKEVIFTLRYLDGTTWDTTVKLSDPVQDAMELRQYITEKVCEFERGRNIELLSDRLRNMGVVVQQFVSDKVLQYSLFDDRIRHDMLRRVMYNIKDKYGKNIVRKGSELFDPKVLKDAVGFGSVRDMTANDGVVRNQYMLEEDEE